MAHDPSAPPESSPTESSDSRFQAQSSDSISTPGKAVTLRESDGWQISLSPMLDKLAVEPGDYLFVDMDDRDSPVEFQFRLASEEEVTSADETMADRYRKVESTGGNRITLPPMLPQTGLGVDRDSYNSSDPVVFRQLISPDGEAFLLEPLGFASDLFADPERGVEWPFPRNPHTNPFNIIVDEPPEFEGPDFEEVRDAVATHQRDWLVENVAATGADEDTIDSWFQGSQEGDVEAWTVSGPDTGPHYVVVRAPASGEAGNQVNGDGRAHEHDVWVIGRDERTAQYYIEPIEWQEWFEKEYPKWKLATVRRWLGFPEDQLRSLMRKVFSTLRTEQLVRTDAWVGYDPTTVEREGKVLELHYVPQGALAHIMETVYGIDADLAGIAGEVVNRFAHQYLAESYEVRGDTIPDSHHAHELDMVIIPQEPTDRYTTKAARPLDLDEGTVVDEIVKEEAPSVDAVEPIGATTNQSTLASLDDGSEATIDVEDIFDDVVVKRAARFNGQDESTIREALMTAQSELDEETLHNAGILGSRDSVTVGDVTLAFIVEDGLPALLESLTILDAKMAQVVADIHTQQAERLVTESDLDADVQRFRMDADAVVLN